MCPAHVAIFFWAQMPHGQWHMVTIRISRQRCILSSRADWETMRISLAWAGLIVAIIKAHAMRSDSP